MTCRFWIDHMNQTNLQSYKHTTNSLCLPWYLYTNYMKQQSYTKIKIFTILISCCIEFKQKYPTIKSYNTTPISHLSTCPHVPTCSLHWADIPIIIIPLRKFVRYADFELIICIKETYNPTKVQLIPHAYHDIFTLIRWSHKATSKLTYWPSIYNVA